MRVSMGLLCCPFVCGMSVFVTLCLTRHRGVCVDLCLWRVCLWIWGFTLSVACVGLCDALGVPAWPGASVQGAGLPVRS